MPSKRIFARSALSWLVVALGVLIGFFALALLGRSRLPSSDTDFYWPKLCVGFVGVCLLGLIFLSASLVALSNRRRAGLIFLVSTPFVAFCLAFPEAGYLKWEADGGNFYSPFLSAALVLALLFFVPFLVPLFIIRNKKRAVYLFLILAAVVSPGFIFSQWTTSLLPWLAGWSALLVVFGSFWLGTHKRGWPLLITPRPRALSRQVLAVVIT